MIPSIFVSPNTSKSVSQRMAAKMIVHLTEKGAMHNWNVAITSAPAMFWVSKEILRS